jgi:ParB-like chromosome segregation protein Spo0J
VRTVAVMTTSYLTAGDAITIEALDLGSRLRPTDKAHVRLLAEILDETPPVLVLVDGDHLRLLDGFMRVDAARALGRSTVRVQWAHGDEALAVERAVRANASHGLPLSRPQRREAGLRLLALAPGWSDRRIASACGVDPKTVGRWRRDVVARSGGEMPHLSTGGRVGRDGRRYLAGEELEARRAAARQLLQGDPRLSDREVGRRAGLSAATVRRVRAGMSRGTASGAGRRVRLASPAAGLLRAMRVVVRGVTALFGRMLRRR